MGLFSKLLKGPQPDTKRAHPMRKRCAPCLTRWWRMVRKSPDCGLYRGRQTIQLRLCPREQNSNRQFDCGMERGYQNHRGSTDRSDLSGCGDPTYYRREEILKAYRNKYPTDAFIIYPDRSGYIGINAYEWLDDEKLYVYLYQRGVGGIHRLFPK